MTNPKKVAAKLMGIEMICKNCKHSITIQPPATRGIWWECGLLKGRISPHTTCENFSLRLPGGDSGP